MFQQGDAGIQDGLVECPDVRRGVDPRQAGFVKPQAALPALHADNLELGADLPLRVEHSGKLSHRHPVAHRDVVVGHEGLQLVIPRRSLNVHPVNRVGPVQHVEFNARFGRGLQGVSHRRDVGIEARADVLDIEHERVEALQLFRRGPLAVAAIEAVDGDSTALVDAIGNVRLVQFSAQPVLGREDRFEADIWRRGQQVDVAPPQAVDPRVVGQEPDFLATQACETLGCKHIQPRLYGRKNSSVASVIGLDRWVCATHVEVRRDDGCDKAPQSDHGCVDGRMDAIRHQHDKRMTDRVNPQ